MKKILAGLLSGLVLGGIGGAGSWLNPELRPALTPMIAGSAISGMIVGLLSGLFAHRVQSVRWGITAGAGLGLLFGFWAATQTTTFEFGTSRTWHPYFEVVTPGFLSGAVIGFLTQRLGPHSR